VKARRTLDELAISGGYKPVGYAKVSVIYGLGMTKLFVKKEAIRKYEVVKTDGYVDEISE